jgi:tetratricopeptide (TPR) repeat protein
MLVGLVAAVSSPRAEPVAAAGDPVLVAGSRMERTVPGDAESRLLIDASAGPLVVVVDQLGIDLALRCDNESHGRNSPAGRWGAEIVVVERRCAMTIRARNAGAPMFTYKARAFAFDSDEGRRLPRRTWELWSQAHYDSGAAGTSDMSSALVSLRDVEKVVATRGDSDELRFLRIGNAHLLRRLGRHEEAVLAYQAFIRTLDPARHAVWLMRASNGNGLSLRELDRFDDADEAFADAVRYGAGRGDAYEWVSAKNNRCLILHTYGKLAAARDCYAAVIPDYRELAPDHVAVPMLNLAAAADTLGEPGLALRHYRAALELRRGGTDRSSLGIVLLNLAAHEAQTGAWPDALEHSLEAQNIFESLGDKPRTATMLNLRGWIYNELREPDRARDYLEQSVRIAQESKDPAAIALSKSALARIDPDPARAAQAHREVVDYFMQTKRSGLASQEWIMLAERLDALGDDAGRDAALDSCEALLPANGSRSYKASVATLRARVALRRGLLPEALKLAQQAIDWRAQTREIDGQTTVRLLKARIERRAGNGDAALAEIERALAELTRAERLPASPVLAANLYDRRAELLDEAMDILLGADAVTDAAMAKAWALKWTYSRAPDNAAAPAPLDAAERELLDELRAKVMLLASAQTPGTGGVKSPPPDVLADIARRVDAIESQLDTRRAEGAGAAAHVLGLPALQAALRADEVLVSLNLGSRASGAWISTVQATRWIALPARAVLLRPIEAALTRQDMASFDQLSTLLSPLLAAAGPARRVMIVPDGPSHLIPFAALRNAQDEFWIERSSIELLARPPSQPQQLRPAALARGFPVVVWGAGDSTDADTDVVARSAESPVYRSGTALVELPAIATEMRLMKRVLGLRRVSSGDPRAIAVPADAGHWMLHVAGHGLASSSHPYAASLALPNPDGSSGFTFMSGQGLHLGQHPPNLVFVNVCEGFSGRQFESQPPSSLARRFLQAGAGVVIAAAWPIEDGRAARFAERVYAELDRAPADIAEAIARAQRESLRSGGLRGLRYWAGYSVVRAGW